MLDAINHAEAFRHEGSSILRVELVSQMADDQIDELRIRRHTRGWVASKQHREVRNHRLELACSYSFMRLVVVMRICVPFTATCKDHKEEYIRHLNSHSSYNSLDFNRLIVGAIRIRLI
jgi:hypothetical protein